jgi:RNA polymerase sigma factor (TIGR02999 family)
MEKTLERENASDVTVWLRAWSAGDPDALGKLAPILHTELKRIAHGCMRRERKDHTLQPSALVNEAFLRLINGRAVQWQDRAHFFALSAQMMRRILVNYAVARVAAKRGGLARKISLEEAVVAAPERSFDVVELNEALERLARLDSRKAQIVELYFFGGLRFEETAAVLKLSERTVRRDWNMSKTWLAREMSHRINERT